MTRTFRLKSTFAVIGVLPFLHGCVTTDVSPQALSYTLSHEQKVSMWLTVGDKARMDCLKDNGHKCNLK